MARSRADGILVSIHRSADPGAHVPCKASLLGVSVDDVSARRKRQRLLNTPPVVSSYLDGGQWHRLGNAGMADEEG